MPREARPSTDEDTRWGRLLLIGVVALVAVALVIGGVFSVLALGAAKVSGLGHSSARSSANPSLLLPSPSPTTSAAKPPASSAGPVATPTPTRSKKPAALTLTATPSSVPAGGRIVLAGTAAVAPGVRLQVQRFEDGWVDFPVTVSVTAGTFNTYITTSHTGANRLRVVAPGSAKTSNVVRVTVG